MNTLQDYKGFNREKSIEELQYTMLNHIESLQVVKEDLQFLQFLTQAQIFNPNTMDLFERLEHFKKELDKRIHKSGKLIIDANFHANQIANKIECDELACDNYFINAHNELEQYIHQFSNQTSKFKQELFQYFKSVIKTA
ncbi:MAG: hypothetical protein CMP05_10515 [Xanthomarina sp.]|uniref:hypothetical protein n=1 Tax=Xanthomarina sp. TaxID=1931211 RepID=UPI000C582FEB|nr:hypothetical protein [Xanthomarina sp.]MAL24014.1 hypothetical protein [Xanthomarina sp.]MBF62417.1 hypothetical protein [Xanthomarina sp.]HAB28910.1 hypothetical protein [Xanthomarina gelatinilytica]HAI17422.1 hypothetical protein [Xanthomarina gelatinilytica]|tara:strand:- start:1411 stop:1830 length:420 start_codon:yes stop_codon:yes gene_type:complete